MSVTKEATEEPIRGVGYWIWIERPPKQEVSEGGIVLPHQIQQNVFYGRVIAVGRLVEQVRVGDIIVCTKAGAEPIEFESLAKEKLAENENIMAVIEDMVTGILTEAEALRRGLRIGEIGKPAQEPVAQTA